MTEADKLIEAARERMRAQLDDRAFLFEMTFEDDEIDDLARAAIAAVLPMLREVLTERLSITDGQYWVSPAKMMFVFDTLAKEISNG